MPDVPASSLLATTRWLLQILIRLYLLVLAPITLFQRSLIYQPTRSDRLSASQFKSMQQVVDVTIHTSDGLKLHGWLTLAGTSTAFDPVDVKQALSDGRPVVLYFPGNAGNRSRRSIQFDVMNGLGAHMLLVDYRGYGDNPGKPSEGAFARDARTVWNHLNHDLSVVPHRIVIYGESLGGGVATRLASDLCREGIQPGGLILQSTFSSLAAAGQYHFPLVPVSILLADRFPSDKRIKDVTCPILQIHGLEDSVVPFAIGQRLFDAAPPASSQGIPKRLIAMPGTDHNDVYMNLFNRENGLEDGLKDFLDAAQRRSESEAAATTPADSHTPLPATTEASTTLPVDRSIIGSIILLTLACGVWWFGQSKKPGKSHNRN